MKFADLRLAEPILATVADEGYTIATPIQAQAIPHVVAGRDLLGCAQTGTGKTAAFALPILNRLAGGRGSGGRRSGGRRLPRALVLAPTRELAQQIADSFQTYGRRMNVSGAVIYGGVGQGPQVQKLRRGVDVVVATPGRLLDLINQGHCDLSAIDCCVLDEADRMLDMGFLPDIKRISSYLPERRQTLLFSATMPREIRQLAGALLDEPAEVTIAPESPAVDRIVQSVYHVDKPAKSALLCQLIDTLSISRAIVFMRTKHGADRVVRHLKRTGAEAEAIHGNKTQNARQRTLERFRSGRVNILVATDIAARGIDVDGISHIFNYDIARDPESHVHRIGRTARAGAEGTAISFCDRDEIPHLRAIERLIRMDLTVVGDEPAYATGRGKAEPKPKPEPRASVAAGAGSNKARGNKQSKRSRQRSRMNAQRSASGGQGRPRRGRAGGKRPRPAAK